MTQRLDSLKELMTVLKNLVKLPMTEEYYYGRQSFEQYLHIAVYGGLPRYDSEDQPQWVKPFLDAENCGSYLIPLVQKYDKKLTTQLTIKDSDYVATLARLGGISNDAVSFRSARSMGEALAQCLLTFMILDELAAQPLNDQQINVGLELKPFKPTPIYFKMMDMLEYIEEDTTTISHYVSPGMSILTDVDNNIIGTEIYGVNRAFNLHDVMALHEQIMQKQPLNEPITADSIIEANGPDDVKAALKKTITRAMNVPEDCIVHRPEFGEHVFEVVRSAAKLGHGPDGLTVGEKDNEQQR